MNLAKREHLPTLSVSAFWFSIVLLVLLCGCGVVFVSLVPIFPQPTAAPPRFLPTEPVKIETPEPTPPPTQIPKSAPVTAQVIEVRVNLRAAPNTGAEIVGKVEKNDQLTLLGRSQDSQWYQVTLAGKTELAWVFGDTLQIVSGDPKTLPAVKTP